jgi:hypothetical protein
VTVRRIAYKELEGAGRLGNQLWEIASTLGFARAHDTEPLFPETWSYRPWFSLPDDWFGDDAAIRRAWPAQKFSSLPGIQVHYLQQWEYIRWVMPEVQEAFTPSLHAGVKLLNHLADTHQGYLLELADDPSVITLHVRRGDALNPETHPRGTWPTVTMDYYQAALSILDFDLESPIVVFSDDPGWCEENMAPFIGEEGHYVHSGPTRPPDYEPENYKAAEPMDWIDLQLMGMFNRHIIANSTYSLWGAMLGPGPTVYPDNWVGFRCRSAVPEESTMVPPEWVQVHNPVAEEELHAVRPR